MQWMPWKLIRGSPIIHIIINTFINNNIHNFATDIIKDSVIITSIIYE